VKAASRGMPTVIALTIVLVVSGLLGYGPNGLAALVEIGLAHAPKQATATVVPSSPYFFASMGDSIASHAATSVITPTALLFFPYVGRIEPLPTATSRLREMTLSITMFPMLSRTLMAMSLVTSLCRKAKR